MSGVCMNNNKKTLAHFDFELTKRMPKLLTMPVGAL